MKMTFKTLEEIPEQYRGLAKKVGEVFELAVAPQAKLDEFRENNIKKSTELDEANAKLAAWDKVIGKKADGAAFTPDEFAAHIGDLTKTAQQVADGKLKASSEIDAELDKRTATMRSSLEGQVAEARAEAAKQKKAREDAEMRVHRMTVEHAITQVAADDKTGLNMAALPDVLNRAHNVWHIEEGGRLVPKEGGAIVRGEDGTSPMSVSEWFGKLRKDAPYYFKSSTGGGAVGGAGEGGAQYGGMTKADFDKLPAEQRLSIVNKANAAGLKTASRK